MNIIKDSRNIIVLCNKCPGLSMIACSPPGIHSHVSQGQTAVKDVSGLSMKTGRAMFLQILNSGENQAI